MLNIAMQTVSEGDSPDVGLLSAASRQELVTIDSQPGNDDGPNGFGRDVKWPY